MRDIRDDLKERLAATTTKRANVKAHFENQLKSLDEEAATLSKLLSFEEHRFREFRTGGRDYPAPTTTLAEFIVEQLLFGPMSKDGLRAAAEKEGYFPDNGSGGRTLHATLLNVLRSGRVVEHADGTYEIPRVSDETTNDRSRVTVNADGEVVVER